MPHTGGLQQMWTRGGSVQLCMNLSPTPAHRRRYGWAYTLKWALCIGLCYLVFVQFWNAQYPDEHSSHNGEHAQHIAVHIPSREAPPVQTSALSSESDVIAVLVMCATRDRALSNHLQQLLKQRPSADRFPVYISQDGDARSVALTAKDYVDKFQNVHFMQHSNRQPARNPSQKAARNYFYIAQHYKWALDQVFSNHSTVIITEDDLDIALDFFSYFAATKQILDEDPSVWCISAWNDNGAANLADRKRSDLLYRTDFFPGLGWMLKADVWRELSEKWPEAYWDDWMRQPEVRKNRVCIRPEISRTAHNNQLAGKGSSGGLYKSYLASIRLPDVPIDFSLVDMSRLIKKSYDTQLRAHLLASKPITISMLLDQTGMNPAFSYRCVYSDPRQFRKIATKFKLMNDIRSGMVRTAYYGVVPFLANGIRVFAVHENLNLDKEWIEMSGDKVYDVKWDKMNRFLDFATLYCRPGKWTGVCDPNAKAMRDWFTKRAMTKRLAQWGEMIVF